MPTPKPEPVAHTTKVDWHDVARHGPIRRLGQSLRRQLNVWVGFVGTGGSPAPIGAVQPVEKPLCEAFMGRRDDHGSCLESIRAWQDDLRDGGTASCGPSLAGCHAGLRALIVPIAMDDEIIGTVYASGFVPASDDDEDLADIFERGRQLDLGRSTVGAGTRELVRLTEREMRLVGDLLENIAAEVRGYLGTHDGSADAVIRPSGAKKSYDFSAIIGESTAMQRLFKLLEKVCESESTVLIQGEPGVGKELVAQAIHYNSPRADQPFVVQNCSAMNDSLLDSELFGHKKGSFTGAITDKQGLFEMADRGTFFLDEIGDMTPMLQVKLLRVLQEGTFLPVGDTVVRKVDVRVIAATNRNLQKMMDEGTFREDLFYRLNVIPVPVPPLRERIEDVPLLIEHFLEVKAAHNMQPQKDLSEDALERMVSYSWPGNVRELENEVEKLVVMSGDDEPIPETLLSPRIRAASGQSVVPGTGPVARVPANMTLPDALESLERHMIHEKLKKTGWNKTQTAKALGISRRNLIRKVDRYQLDELRPDDM